MKGLDAGARVGSSAEARSDNSVRDRALEGAWLRARHDTTRIAQSLSFVVVTLILNALAAYVAATQVAENASGVAQGGAAAVGAVAGGLASLLSVFVVQFALAPYRQRDEARAVMTGPDPVEPHAFSQEFSEFVRIAQATRPQGGLMGDITMVFDLSRADRARDTAARQRADDEARRSALAEYHRRFRARLRNLMSDRAPAAFVEVHNDRATAPKDFGDLVRLDNALRRLVSGVPSVMNERLHAAEKLRLQIGVPHVANSRQDYERWRTETVAILGEQGRSRADAFAALGEPRGERSDRLHQETELRAQLDRDIAMLRRFAQEA